MRDIGKILIRTHFDRFPRDQLAIRDVMVGEASVRCLARPKRRGRARAKKVLYADRRASLQSRGHKHVTSQVMPDRE